METYVAVVSSSEMATVNELMEYNLDNFSTPTDEPSIGPLEKVERATED